MRQRCHARVLERVNSFKASQETLLTFDYHYLGEKLPFGDPFLDSGVVRHLVRTEELSEPCGCVCACERESV